MSLARYLSKLGALLNSSGQVPASGLASGAVTADAVGANTITLAKLARVGTAGQVLTSGGAGADPSYQALPAGGVTSLNGQTGAITDTTVGSIGSYVVASTTSSGTVGYAAGATVAGSALIVSRTGGGYAAAPILTGNPSDAFGSAGLSGTWRAMMTAASASSVFADSAYRTTTLWVRIS